MRSVVTVASPKARVKSGAVAGNAGADGIASGHQCAAGRGADGRVRIPVGEAGAVGGESVDVGRAKVGGAVAAEVVGALIVRHEDNDVGAGRGLRLHGRGQGGGGEEVASGEWHGLPSILAGLEE